MNKLKDGVAAVLLAILGVGMLWSIIDTLGVFTLALVVVIIALYIIDLDEKEKKNERSSKGTEDWQ